ncbi:MAG: hypothetical protein R2795_15970 [Saprospiraceae bacterium]
MKRHRLKVEILDEIPTIFDQITSRQVSLREFYQYKLNKMAFIKSISGFRGTIGGKAGENLTPQDIVECTAAYAEWMVRNGKKNKVVLGRDARPSGEMVSQLVTATLVAKGFDVVIDLGLSTTPTVEMAVPHVGAGGGIILTASHNPHVWNAL